MSRNRDVYEGIFQYVSPSMDDFDIECNCAQAELTPYFIHSIIELIPKEWIIGIELDIIALERYLIYRIEHLEKIRDVILNEGRLYRG
jgi:hypothetical protein